jgi:hypothetical protein
MHAYCKLNKIRASCYFFFTNAFLIYVSKHSVHDLESKLIATLVNSPILITLNGLSMLIKGWSYLWIATRKGEDNGLASPTTNQT